MGDAIAVALRHENVYLNIADWAPQYYPELLIRYMNGSLNNKVFFGSDFPLVSRKKIVSGLRGHRGIKPEVAKLVLSANPKRFLGIE